MTSSRRSKSSASPHRAGEILIIAQDALTFSMAGPSKEPEPALLYKLNRATSRASIAPHGPVDVVARTRWEGSALVMDERRWLVHGQEPTNVRQVLWVDDRGFLNLELSTPQPIGQYDRTTIVLTRAEPRPPGGNGPAGDR